MSARKLNKHEEEVLEAHLAGTLKRVTPSGDLVQRLQGRLRVPDRSQITLRLRDWNKLFVIFGGVMSGMLLLVTLARAFYYLAGSKPRL